MLGMGLGMRPCNLIMTCTFRRKEIKASSVAELCDLSHYDDILTSSNNPSCGSTSATTTLNSNQGTSHFPNSVRGQSSASTGITADSGQAGGTLSQDMQGVGQSCQDATGQHKMMKQVSTSSIQVGEGTM